MELGELEPDEAAAFMEELGIAESGLERVIRLSYRLLGPDLVPHRGPGRGPRVADPDGSTAVDAAGAIHTDLAKGFIRAETVGYEDLAARSDRRPRRERPASSAPRARPTASLTATSSRSCSAADRARRPVARRARRGSASSIADRRSSVAVVDLG